MHWDFIRLSPDSYSDCNYLCIIRSLFLKLEYVPEAPQWLGKIQNMDSILDHL